MIMMCIFFFQAEDGIRDIGVTGVQTCALPIYNFLNVSGSWDDASGEVNTRQSIGQRLDNKSFFANNVTHWIKRGENEKGVELMLRNAYRTQPHHLRITPGLYPDLINAGNE